MKTSTHCVWYTVWDKALGFKTTDSFWSSIHHSKKRGRQRKYEILREEIPKVELG